MDLWLARHYDMAFVKHVILRQFLLIELPVGHHLYSCPNSISNDVFSMKKAKIKPVI